MHRVETEKSRILLILAFTVIFTSIQLAYVMQHRPMVLFDANQTLPDNPMARSDNLNAPQLLGASVTPLQGTNTSIFNFTVTYYDTDNDLPSTITVSINESTYAMANAVPADTNVTDGKVYTYSRSLSWGIYRFQMNCSDGVFQNSTSWQESPVVNPFLVDDGAPKVIKNVAIFRDRLPWGYNAVVSRLVSLGISYSVFGSSSLGIISLAPYDKVVIESYQSTSFYNVLVQSSVRSWIEAFVTSGGIFEMHHWTYGTSYDIVGTLPGGYSDVASSGNTIVINPSYSTHPILSGVTGAGLSGLGDSSESYLSGLIGSEQILAYDNVYSYPRLLTRNFGAGMMIYVSLAVEFGVANNRGTYVAFMDNLLRYSHGTGFNPALTSPTNASSVGVGNITFSWTSVSIPTGTVTYRWQLSVNNTFDTIIDEVYGIPGTTSMTSFTRNVTRASGTYYWRVRGESSPFTGNWSQSGCMYLRQQMTLTEVNLFPFTGNTNTVFIFKVLYSHPDNIAPSYVYVHINSNTFGMSKVNNSDVTYPDGCAYFRTLSLPTGSYNYYFSAYDGIALKTTSVYSGPSVTTTNTAPALNSGNVSPPNGVPSTTFTYTVIYTDAENNAPSYVRVNIDGSSYSMTKVDWSDHNYTDGCVYSYSRTLGPALHAYNFTASDGSLTFSTSTYSGPTVTNNAPTLTSGSYFPGIGNTNTQFNFSVVYTDVDNDAPSYVRICLNGSDYTMAKQNNGDVTYTDGCVYVLLGYLSPGIHNISYTTSDGYATNTTQTVSGPTVTSTIPGLTSASVSPGIGNFYSTFTFRVTYTDVDNDTPAYIFLTINGSQYAMAKQDSTDADYTDGCVYFYQLSSLSTGTYSYCFIASDGFNTATTTTYTGPTVHSSNTVPLLSGSVSPGTGNIYTKFIYRVVYTDAENDAPYYIRVYIDGTYYSMSKQNSSDYTYTDGCVYYYSRALSTGIHNYYFYASDWYGATATSTSSGPSVGSTNTAPILTSDSVSPTSGNAYSTFVYRVVYTDAENDAPYYIRVYIDGTYYSMSKQNSSDYTYTDGCVYYYSRTLSIGSHTYYFYAHDGIVDTTTPTVSAPIVGSTNTPPVLSGMSISPTRGSWATLYYYFVTYTDAENDAPYSAYVYIDGSATGMSKWNPSDLNYVDGCVYYQVRSLSLGQHNCYFYFSDGINSTTSPKLNGPLVINNAPTLTFGNVSPTNGTVSTYFTFTVTYTDADNNAPSYVRVYIDGTYYSMSKQNSGDGMYADGCIYVYNRTLVPTSHNYYFSTSDGYTTNTTSTYSGPTVTNNAPTLAIGSLTPSSGLTTTTFTYTVTYTDSDNNAPYYIRVYIDGSGYSMWKQNSGDYAYTDGCVYVYSRTLWSGSHNYYFSASDGYASTTTSTYSGPYVQPNRPPTLDSGSVSPATGVPNTLFTFSVTYTDEDNNHPYYIQLYIDGNYWDMNKQDWSDDTYTDGVLYTFQMNLLEGSHSYYFYCSDGSSSYSTGYREMSVTRYSENSVGTTAILLLVFLIAVPLFIGIAATKAYNKKKGITHAPSQTLYIRPSPSFTPGYYGSGASPSTQPASFTRPLSTSPPTGHGSGGSGSTSLPSSSRPLSTSPVAGHGSFGSGSTSLPSSSRPLSTSPAAGHGSGGSGSTSLPSSPRPLSTLPLESDMSVGWTSTITPVVPRSERILVTPGGDRNSQVEPRLSASITHPGDSGEEDRVYDASKLKGASGTSNLLVEASSVQGRCVLEPVLGTKQETSPRDTMADMTIDEIEKQLITTIIPVTDTTHLSLVQAPTSKGFLDDVELNSQSKHTRVGGSVNLLDVDSSTSNKASTTPMISSEGSSVDQNDVTLEPLVSNRATLGEQEPNQDLHQDDSGNDAELGSLIHKDETETPLLELAPHALEKDLLNLESSLLEQIDDAKDYESRTQDDQDDSLIQHENILKTEKDKDPGGSTHQELLE